MTNARRLRFSSSKSCGRQVGLGIVVAALAALPLAACHRGSPWVEPAAMEPSLAEQIERVRSGESDAIVVKRRTMRDEDLERLRGLDSLRELVVERSEATAKGIAVLQTVEGLETLKIRGAVDDEAAEAISELRGLISLNLPGARFTDEGLGRLASLPRLRQLRFGSPLVSDRGMEHLAGMQSLRFLHLIDVPISDAGLAPLHELKQLESFYLDGSRVTDEGLKELFAACPGIHFHRDQRHLDWDPTGADHGH